MMILRVSVNPASEEYCHNCVCVRLSQAWHLSLSPLWKVLDHTNHTFSESTWQPLSTSGPPLTHHTQSGLNGWKWMKVDESGRNGWKWMKVDNMDESGWHGWSRWKWMKLDEIWWKWMKMDERGWKWMNRDEHGWTWMNSMKVDESGWKWMTDADAVTPSTNTRSYTLRSVPSSPGRSFLF